jgi:hypothetical protein
LQTNAFIAAREIQFTFKGLHMNHLRRVTLFQMFGMTAGLAALTACGGGDSDPPAAPPVTAAPPAPAPVTSACTPSTNAKVGRTGTFTTRSHLVSGQARLVDSCTIEITNFNYDGLGLATVVVYGGLAGDYRNGFPIGDNLRGRVFTGQTLRVTMKAGDIDKLDGISIWCTDANANFGDLTFA